MSSGWQHGSQTQMWIQRHPGPLRSTRPPVTALIIEVFQGDNSENEPFFISDISLLGVRVIMGLGSLCGEQEWGWGPPRRAATPCCGLGRREPREVDAIMAGASRGLGEPPLLGNDLLLCPLLPGSRLPYPSLPSLVSLCRAALFYS
ncbi:rCG57458, isoform CRA_a [Rattus norvegicus]|uniref:RCG57458, isoform CRA_a n=1 Tax=Rattus norvegicus TaxID=10116 RepID=A6JI40_RAT|nr:rCG57458, isoform CRA_a [Rattus norvegicus]